MYELTITQRIKYGDKVVLYFEKNQFEDMCILMQSVLKASRHEIEFSIKEIEESEVIENED